MVRHDFAENPCLDEIHFAEHRNSIYEDGELCYRSVDLQEVGVAVVVGDTLRTAALSVAGVADSVLDAHLTGLQVHQEVVTLLNTLFCQSFQLTPHKEEDTARAPCCKEEGQLEVCLQLFCLVAWRFKTDQGDTLTWAKSHRWYF